MAELIGEQKTINEGTEEEERQALVKVVDAVSKKEAYCLDV